MKIFSASSCSTKKHRFHIGVETRYKHLIAQLITIIDIQLFANYKDTLLSNVYQFCPTHQLLEMPIERIKTLAQKEFIPNDTGR